MIAIIGLFVILILALMVIRIGAIALELTGLSTDVAAFQAQSAFSGVGFTTSESESIVNHPVRRKIIRTLILSINRNENNEENIIIPFGDTVIHEKNQLMLYGRGVFCHCLANRPKGEKGDRAHRYRVELQFTSN